MRQLHLLLAEWRFEQQLEYGRFYKLICCWAGEKTPTLEEVFPLAASANEEEQPEDADDFVLFSQAAATLGAT